LSTTVKIPKLLEEEFIFPNPLKAHEQGLLAWGGDLCEQRLLSAYHQGIFPWYSKGDPILWWSPDPRLILFPQNLKVSKSFKQSIKKYEIRFNTNFEAVISTCKDLRKDTWISEQMQEAYINLHKLGIAKSVETYYEDALVGGLYGVMVGSVFCGESMFSTKSDASKVALWGLCQMMIKSGGDFIDCQMPTSHLISLGAQIMEREEYLKRLSTCKDKKVELS
jgi:leucyl/phenylalanyl-tRNA--protein transferase